MFVQKKCLDRKVTYILGQTRLGPKYFHRPRHWSNLVCLRTKWEGVASSRLILFLRYSLYALSPTWSPPPHYSCLLIIGETITAAREYLCSRHSSAMYLLSILSDFEAYSNCSQAFCFYLIWVSESVQWVIESQPSELVCRRRAKNAPDQKFPKWDNVIEVLSGSF